MSSKRPLQQTEKLLVRVQDAAISHGAATLTRDLDVAAANVERLMTARPSR